MATTYLTRQGEMIDAICFSHYGDESGYVEAVLAANPGLAALTQPLPAGTRMTLPDIPAAVETVQVITLWD